MFTHPAEQFYYQVYHHHLQPYFKQQRKVIEFGCQHGRFTIPLINEGHTVIATDIKRDYEQSIRSELKNDDRFTFHCEPMTTSVERLDFSDTDVVLCLELLYTHSNFEELISKCCKKMKKGSLFIASHRSIGYYAARYLKEEKYEELKDILNNTHQAFNAQTADHLYDIYTKAGFTVHDVLPIGLYSGFGNDPFTNVINAENLSQLQAKQLLTWELDKTLQEIAKNNARYLMVIAEVNS